MFNLENASTIEALRRQDEIAAAEKHRLIKEITGQRSVSGKWRGRILARLGAKMVTWGYKLQSRYDGLLEPNVSANIPGNDMTPC
jgi:hypothetical protein